MPLPARAAPIQRRRLPQPWREELLLDGQRRVLLRPIDPADAAPLRHGFGLLSTDEVRLRFLHPMSELTPALARQLTTLDPAREFALVAAEPLPPGEALIGAVVRAAIDPVGRRAEFAIIVARLLAGQGLGRLLLRKLIRWARLRRLDELYGDVLVENVQMLALVRTLGFQAEPLAGEPGVMRVRLDLRRAAAAGATVGAAPAVKTGVSTGVSTGVKTRATTGAKNAANAAGAAAKLNARR